MSEFRKDPLHNKWVLFVPERSKRPHAFFNGRDEKDQESEKDCPFCEGKEKLTPPEVDSFREQGRADEPGWLVRVFPNKYPALNKEAKMRTVVDKTPYLVEGYGFHEVIAESPSHTKDLYSMTPEEIILILKMYRKRYNVLKEKKDIKSIFIFKNHGRAAGASLLHSHSQILALPIVPPFVEEETILIVKSKKCIYCGLIEEASADGRVLLDEGSFIVFAPYASRYPYQLLLLPKNHEPFFEETEDEQLIKLADVLKEVFFRYEKLFGNIPFNYFLNSFPVQKGHWNIQIMPKLTIPAGFEKGTGIFINPVLPKKAVEELKEIK
jgi:UDPglucose--hexose-1-phosphate uridylyltransferase